MTTTITARTTFTPSRTIEVLNGSNLIGTVKDGKDPVRNIDRLLTKNGFVRTTGFVAVYSERRPAMAAEVATIA
jgi:hypothetical protein